MRRRGGQDRSREVLRDEVGTIRKDAPLRVALVYPSPYKVAMSSLGYQTLYRLFNELPGVCCERAMLDEPSQRERLRTLESGRPVADAAVIGLSVATEAEVALAARALIVAGVPPLEVDRRGQHHQLPLVVAGGPLTYADGSPLCALADVVLSGEAEDGLSALAELLIDGLTGEALFEKIAELPGAVVPALGEPTSSVEPAQAHHRWLPAASVVTTPRAEFGDMFLIEPARGCPWRCSFCVMEPGRFRAVATEEVLSQVPDRAHRVGLVGSALLDHPKIDEIMERLVSSGRQVSLSSVRADRLNEEMMGWLVRGGARSLTIAADGASERLRRMVRKKVDRAALIRATELAARSGLRGVKLYAMVGLPSETDDDIAELCELALELSGHLPINLSVSPFVPKARTTLADASFAPLPVLRSRLALIRKRLRGHVELGSASVRAAWIENAVARGGFRAGLAAVEVANDGVYSFAAWKRAFERHELLTAPADRARRGDSAGPSSWLR